MRISYFAPNTEQGQTLVKKVQNAIKGEFDIAVYYSNQATQADFLVAVHNCDVVIVDCTLPDEFNKTSESIYPLLTAQINIFEHVIVVSTSQLPLNINPARGIYPQTDTDIVTERIIVDNISRLISQVAHEANYERLYHCTTLEELLAHKEEMDQMMVNALTKKEDNSSKKKKVMISYRNNYSNKVEDFKKEIVRTCDVDIKVLPPASLCGADEAHTPMRRWMLVGLLEDHIREVDEVWVYETEDYFNSWWTIAELVMVAYINHDRKNKVLVKVYNPNTKTFYETVPDKYHVTINEEQNQRLARNLSNTRPDTMGPECLQQVQQLQLVADFLRLASEKEKSEMLKQMKQSFEYSVPSSLSVEERNEMIEGMIKMYSSPDEIERYISDDVFQAAFWLNISYQTSSTTSAFHQGHIDVEQFIKTPISEATNYTPNDIANIAKGSGIIEIGDEKQKYYVTIGNPSQRYLWLATRMGQPTIKDAPGLEVIDIFNLKKI